MSLCYICSDDSMGYQYPFTLRVVGKDGNLCAWCPWYRWDMLRVVHQCNSSCLSLGRQRYCFVLCFVLNLTQSACVYLVKVLPGLHNRVHRGQGLCRKRLYRCGLGPHCPASPLPDLTGEGESIKCTQQHRRKISTQDFRNTPILWIYLLNLH